MSFSRAAIVMAAVFVLRVAAPAAASAQVMYNGWNTGPDYRAMLDQSLRQGQALSRTIEQARADSIRQTMQNPDCWAKFQQYRANGGTLDYPSFAHQYAASGGFTAGGTSRYWDSQRANEQGEARAQADERRAEHESADAIGQWQNGYARGQAEQGRVMQGQSTWYDVQTGQSHVLPYLQPGTISRDPSTGQTFGMDQNGNYFAQYPNGQW